MFTMRIAEHTVSVDNRFPLIHRQCRDYLVPEEEGCPVLRASDADLALEAQLIYEVDGTEWPDDYLESCAIHRKLFSLLLPHDVIVFHSSAIGYEGKAYLFAGVSGAGKSTHAGLWQTYLGSAVTRINDDKPLLHVTDSGVAVFGTPFSGKAGIQTNTSAPLAGIVFIRQAEEDRIRPLSFSEAYPRLLAQTQHPEDAASMAHTMDLIGILAQYPLYELSCTISPHAVTLCKNTLTQKGGSSL